MALVFADRILCAEYYAFVMAQFIQHVHLADCERLACLAGDGDGVGDGNGGEPLLREDTPGWRFLRDWRAWMAFLKLYGYKLEDAEKSASRWGWPGQDPRLFEREHWDESCSFATINNTRCRHAYRRRRIDDRELRLAGRHRRRSIPWWGSQEWRTRVGLWASYPAAGIWVSCDIEEGGGGLIRRVVDSGVCFVSLLLTRLGTLLFQTDFERPRDRRARLLYLHPGRSQRRQRLADIPRDKSIQPSSIDIYTGERLVVLRARGGLPAVALGIQESEILHIGHGSFCIWERCIFRSWGREVFPFTWGRE